MLFLRGNPCIAFTHALWFPLHRARSASRSKSHPEAVRGSRKAESEKSTEATDESATGSVYLWSGPFASILLVPHLRPPSIDHGIVSFLWALGLGAFVWIGLLSVTVFSQATCFVLALLAGFFIFLFVRLCGGDEPRRTGP